MGIKTKVVVSQPLVSKFGGAPAASGWDGRAQRSQSIFPLETICFPKIEIVALSNFGSATAASGRDGRAWRSQSRCKFLKTNIFKKTLNASLKSLSEQPAFIAVVIILANNGRNILIFRLFIISLRRYLFLRELG